MEAPSRVNAGQKQDTTEGSRFLSKHPTAVYGGRSGRSYIPYSQGSGQREAKPVSSEKFSKQEPFQSNRQSAGHKSQQMEAVVIPKQVGGALRYNVQDWTNITDSSWVLQAV